VTDAVDADRHPRDDPDRLRKLYHEEGLTTYAMAEHFGVQDDTVRRWMRTHNINRRRSPVLSGNRVDRTSYDRAYRDPDYLHTAYWGREQSLAEIADIFNITVNTVVYWMREHGIPRRGGVS
jgi:transposase-like protein